MTGKALGPALKDKDIERKVRQQLARVLASQTFQHADRLKRFLSFIVLEALAGRGDALKEYVVGVQVFGKEEAFDPRTDPVVRVQARRLRARLVRYYREEGVGDEVLIELPKGGYTPLFTFRERPPVQRPSPETVLISRNTVAVAPFADHSGGRDLEAFCRGVRDEVVHRLTNLGRLRVVAWETLDPDGQGVGRPLRADVAAVVVGTVRQAGERVRVTTQVVDGASGCYLWSESLDVSLESPLEAQEQVALVVSRRLEVALSDVSAGRLSGRATTNLAAHNLYLQGRYHLNQRTEEGLRKAVEFFERALVEDAHYALAHSGLADAYGLLAHYGVLGPAEVWTKAAASAAAAVMLDSNSAEAQTSLAHVKATQDWDWQGAELGYQRAIAIDPRYATARHWYAASCLAPLGRLDEALEQMQIAQSLDPVSSIIGRDLASVYYYRREFDLALEQCDQTIELNPFFSPAYWTLGLIQEQRRELDESVAAFERAADLAPRSPRMRAALGRSYALTGRRDRARAILRELQQLAQQRYVSPFEFASIYFALGQTDVGFVWMGKACEERCFDLILMKVDPRFDPIRSDPRFAAIARKVGVD